MGCKIVFARIMLIFERKVPFQTKPNKLYNKLPLEFQKLTEPFNLLLVINQ